MSRTLHRPSRRAIVIAAVGVLVLLGGVLAALSPRSSDNASTVTSTGLVAGPAYRATIRRTDYGVPHILADDLGSAGFGQGWAFAEDRFCDLDEQIVEARSELSRWLGPGPGDTYLGSDLALLHLGLMKTAQAQVPHLEPDVRALLQGYAAGFDGYLQRTGSAKLPGWCASQTWVTPITAVDLLAYQQLLAIQDSGAGFLRAIVTAQPPASASTSSTTQGHDSVHLTAATVRAAADAVLNPQAARETLGSNGWAIGATRTAGSGGVLVANPHYPWQGVTFWECQLTVPGLLNVYGASLGGLPGVQIGFNDHVAWTHTVSASTQFTLYSVHLVPGHPTEYLFDGRPEAMTQDSVTLTVRGDDGEPAPFHYTMWSTRYGPVLNLSSTGSGLGWSRTRAVTYRDADAGNVSMATQWLHMDEASSLGQFQQAFQAYQAIPWLNTVAADDRGSTWYIDDSAVPNLSPSAAATWARSRGHLLDGSDPAFGWVSAPGSRSPGLVPYGRQPQLTSRDYVFNANNSYWLANPGHPLTGFSPLYGSTGSAQTPRTRQNAVELDALQQVSQAGAAEAMLSEQALTSDLLASSVVAACEGRGTDPVTVSGKRVDLTQACQVLAHWDRHFSVTSRGAVLWREMIASLLQNHRDALTQAGPLFGRAFDAHDPIGTPNELSHDPGDVLDALARAVVHLGQAGVALDAPLGSVQHAVKGDHQIPVPGSADETGILNVVDYVGGSQTLEAPVDDGQPISGSDLTTKGYVVNDGTSFLLSVGFTAQGPVASAVLTLSESDDPGSPHFADQTELFTGGHLRSVLYTETQIKADHALQTQTVSQAART